MSFAAGGYWPWWLGGLFLAAVAVGYLWATGKLLGVSGMFSRVVAIPEEIEAARLERSALADPAGLMAALAAATAAEFGESAVAPGSFAGEPTASIAGRTPWTAHALFLVALAVGGALARLLHGGLHPAGDLGAAFAATLGSGWHATAALLFGGMLVGVGTRMAGGCTSGHGLNGCARLQPGSLVTTATFFGAAILVTFALGRLG
jgi:uncharacterized protein